MKANLPTPSFEEVFGSKTRMKIIKALAQNEELTISLIIDKTKSNHTVVTKHLQYLIELGIVQEKKFGRIKIYRYRIEDVRVRSLKKFIYIWESVEL